MTEEPVPAATVVTIQNTAASTSADILTGEHVVSESILRLNKEWRPKDASAQRFKDNVISLLEGIVNNTNTTLPDQGETDPDPPPGGGGGAQELFYDSGYVYFEVSDSLGWAVVPFQHNFGQVPTRFTLFYSNVAQPNLNNPKHNVYVVTPSLRRNEYAPPTVDLKIGSRLSVKNKNNLELSIAPHGLDGFVNESSKDRIIPQSDGTKRPGYIRLMAWR